MTPRRRDGETFADLAGAEVKPLDGRDKQRPEPEGAAVPSPPPAVTRFEIEHSGARMRARAADVARRQLLRLARGDIPADRELDLHGLTRAQAATAIRAALTEAREAGARCVLVIHGRGAHSEESAVLAEALPDWLQSAPLAASILAFATAPDRLGGLGATLVLLRRWRRPR